MSPALRNRVVATLLFAVGLLYVLPGALAFDPGASLRLYGIALAGEELIVLMRHRAVLLALVGGLLLVAAFRPSLRGTAIAVALVSKLSFVLLFLLAPVLHPALTRVAAADAVSIVLLLAALALGWKRARE